MAYHRVCRPKPAKLAVNLALREKVERDLQKRYSPEQISGRLRAELRDDPQMWVSPKVTARARAELVRAVRAAAAQGMTQSHIAQCIGRSQPDVPRLLRFHGTSPLAASASPC